MPPKKIAAPVEPIEPTAPPAAPIQPVEPVAPTAPIPPMPPQPIAPGDERTWAMMSHLSVLLNLVTGFGGPIAALVIYLVYKDRSRYVAYHSLQSLVFHVLWWIGGTVLAGITWALSGALTVICIGFLLMPLALLFSLAPVGALIYGVVGAIQVSQGQDFKYWLVGDWVRGTLTG